jgi:hypothetical protein
MNNILKFTGRNAAANRRRMMTSTTVMNDDRPIFHVDMTGKEFEAALKTLPQTVQREIEAKLRRMVEDQKR